MGHTGQFPDVFPYRAVIADQVIDYPGARYRLLAYQRIAGRSGAQPGIAVLDEMRHLVLVDELEAGADLPALLDLVGKIATGTLADLVGQINKHPERRFTLAPDGSVLSLDVSA